MSDKPSASGAPKLPPVKLGEVVDLSEEAVDDRARMKTVPQAVLDQLLRSEEASEFEGPS